MKAQTIAVGLFCKAPVAGQSKTRLSPPLSAKDCTALSAAFIRDIAGTIDELVRDGDVTGYAVYTPAGCEAELRTLLPADFHLLAQPDGDFTVRVVVATRALLEAHVGAILVNADSPTLPASILRAAVDVARRGGAVALSPAQDGGYTLIGVSELHERLYADIAWSTPRVYRQTLARASEIGLPAVELPGWYDVDDAASLALLTSELAGAPLPFAAPGQSGAPAPATRACLAAMATASQKYRHHT